MLRFRLVPVVLLCCFLSGCGAYFVGFVSNPGGTSTVVGIVTTVQPQPTGSLAPTVTAVTFLDAGTSVSMKFCGDQQSQFPLDQSVRVTFSTGSNCSTLVSVTFAS